jgi:hypothetical protein
VALAHLPEAKNQPDVEMMAVCDIYQPNLDRTLSMLVSWGRKAQSYTDYRRIGSAKKST